MKTVILNFFKYIAKSVTANSEVSSVRIQTYLLLITILLMSITFIVIEIAHFIVSYQKDLVYNISSEIIIILGMLLSHHLGLALTRKNANVINPTDFLVAKENNKNIKKKSDIPTPDTSDLMETIKEYNENIDTENTEENK